MIDKKTLIELLELEINNCEKQGHSYIGMDLAAAKQIMELFEQRKTEWIPVDERLPEEHELIDDETGYYNKSDEVLCCCKNEYNEFEYWIDYTIDGEWQYSEYIDSDEKYWQPLPEEPYLSGFQYPLEKNSKGETE